MRFSGRLPTGEVTTKPKKYAEAWRALADAVIERLPDLELKALGYEPGILFSRGKYHSISLDTDLCLAIAKLKR